MQENYNSSDKGHIPAVKAINVEERTIVSWEKDWRVTEKCSNDIEERENREIYFPRINYNQSILLKIQERRLGNREEKVYKMLNNAGKFFWVKEMKIQAFNEPAKQSKPNI